MRAVLDSPWGRLFRNWETTKPDAKGYPSVGSERPVLRRTGLRAFAESLRILWLCLKEAPEFGRHRRRLFTRGAR
jgi:hypothetical protein